MDRRAVFVLVLLAALVLGVAGARLLDRPEPPLPPPIELLPARMPRGGR